MNAHITKAFIGNIVFINYIKSKILVVHLYSLFFPNICCGFVRMLFLSKGLYIRGPFWFYPVPMSCGFTWLSIKSLHQRGLASWVNRSVSFSFDFVTSSLAKRVLWFRSTTDEQEEITSVSTLSLSIQINWTISLHHDI